MDLQKIIDQLQNNLIISKSAADESIRLVKNYEKLIETLKQKQKTQDQAEK
jgi:hypothetical protein